MIKEFESLHPQQGLRILEEAANVAKQELANDPTSRVEFLPNGAFIAEIESVYDNNGSNGKNGHYRNGYTTQQQEQITSQDEPEYPLSEVATMLGVVAQHIINLINRFDIIQPKKSTDYSPRETYVFTQEEVQKVGRFFNIREKLHKSVKEAVEMLENDAAYTHAAEKLRTALEQYDGDAEAWMEIVEALSLSPTLTPQEREILLLIEGGKKTPLEAGTELGIKSENKVLRLLVSAQTKAGKSLFDLYKFVNEL